MLPLPITSTPSARSGASAAPSANCSAGLWLGTKASGSTGMVGSG